jgi:hypothetical protein
MGNGARPRASRKGWGERFKEHPVLSLIASAVMLIAAVVPFLDADWKESRSYAPVNVSLDLAEPQALDGAVPPAWWIQGRLVVDNKGIKPAYLLPSIYVASGRRLQLGTEPEAGAFREQLGRRLNQESGSVELARHAQMGAPEIVAAGRLLAGWSLAPGQRAVHDIAFVVPADRFDRIDVSVQVPVSDEADTARVAWEEDGAGGYQPGFAERRGEQLESREVLPENADWFEDQKLELVSTLALLRLPRSHAGEGGADEDLASAMSPR